MTDPDRDLVPATAETDPDALLQRSRRVDWRFLLADPSPGRAGYLGPPDPDLLAVLGEAGWTVEDLEAGQPRPRDEDAARGLDLVVVARPTGRRLAAAAAHVRRGGSVYVACDGPFGGSWRRPRPLDPVQVTRRLDRLGFVAIRTHVEFPGRARRSAIVPLDDPAALRLLVARRRGTTGSRAARGLAEVARRTGWLARLAPAAGVVARRGPVPIGERDAISGYLATAAGATTAGDPFPAPLLLTPDFRASRHVVALVPSHDGPWPALVAKCARRADSGDVTRREADILRSIATVPVVGDGAPRLVATGTPWGLPTLVETGIAGRPLDPAAVRADREGALALAIPWLARLARPPRSDEAGRPAGERIARLLDEPLAAFATAVALGSEDRRRVDRTLAIVEPLRSLVVPDVIEHGDVSHPNLLVTGDGTLAVVDWELAEPHGLPGHDLVGFLAYIATAEARASDAAEQAAAIIGSEASPRPWRVAAEADYARRIGLDPALLPALTVLSWTRRMVGLVERLHDGRPHAVTTDTAAWLRRQRFAVAWAAAVDRSGERA